MIVITKAKMLKDDKIEVSFIRRNKNMKDSSVNEEHKDPAHKDLADAFAGLRIHAGLISEYLKPKQVKDIKNPDPELTEAFNVTGYTLVGGDEDPGVILTATKVLSTGRVLMFNTPTVKLQPADKSAAYEYYEDLERSIDRCNTEMKEYLNGKHAPDNQMTIPGLEAEPEPKITKLKVAEEETPVLGKYASDAKSGDSSPSKSKKGKDKGEPEILKPTGKRKPQTQDNPAGQ